MDSAPSTTNPDKLPKVQRPWVPVFKNPPECAESCPIFQRMGCFIDPRTQEALIGAPEVEQKKNNKTIYTFLGLPGAGKTTLVRDLISATGSPVYHMGKFAKSVSSSGDLDESIQGNIQSSRESGGLIQGLDELFLSEVLTNPSDKIILDGFPRSLDQLKLLQDVSLINNWNVKVIYVSFPVEDMEALRISYQRQVSRHLASGNSLTDDAIKRFQGKISRAFKEDMAVVRHLRDSNIGNLLILDGLKRPEEVSKELREYLGLDFEQLPWNRDTLNELSSVSDDLGIESWATGGSVYRAFWNNNFGPVQDSFDIDVSVRTKEEELRLQSELDRRFPTRRWVVKSWEDLSEREYQVLSDSFSDNVSMVPVTYRQAAVRINNGKIDLVLGDSSEIDLRKGILRIDDASLQNLSPHTVDKVLERAIGQARKAILEYPGLRLEGTLKELYEKKYGLHSPVNVKSKFGDIEHEVFESESGGRVWWNHTFSDSERSIANDIVSNFFKQERKASSPVVPSKSSFPSVLESYRSDITKALNSGNTTTYEYLKNNPPAIPEGFASWLHYVCSESSDSEFKEWFSNQLRSRKPLAGRDSTLETLFNFNQFNSLTFIGNGDQKVTHQGWGLDLHLKQATLQLETDAIISKYPDELKGRIRLANRLALLYHDVGKLKNVNTPGSHEGIGAKMFLKFRPSWIAEDIAQLSYYLIKLHDIFGRLSRGLCEKEGAKYGSPEFDVTSLPSYKGAVDPQFARDEIGEIIYDPNLSNMNISFEDAVSLVKSVWKADVGSVASLRWILPISDDLEKLILAGSPKKREL